MTELLQFMYQGVVNVKHAELSQFMKIAQALQIKGLAMSTTNNNGANSHQHHRRSPTLSPHSNRDNSHADGARNLTTNALDHYPLNSIIESKIQSALLSSLHSSTASLANSLKRSANELGNLSGIDPMSPSLGKKHKRLSSDGNDNDISTESMDENEEVFMPQVSMETPRFDLSTVKRENSDIMSSPVALRSFLPPHFNFDYNSSYNKNADYSNDTHNNSDMEKSNGNGSGNHMDIPPGKCPLVLFLQNQWYSHYEYEENLPLPLVYLFIRQLHDDVIIAFRNKTEMKNVVFVDKWYFFLFSQQQKFLVKLILQCSIMMWSWEGHISHTILFTYTQTITVWKRFLSEQC